MGSKISIYKKVPRVVYYMSLIAPIKSVKVLFNRGWLKSGPIKSTFEKKFAAQNNAKYAASFSHARISLYFILRAINKSGRSKILMTPINIPDMVNVIQCTGFTPEFVDLETNSYAPCLSKLEQVITGEHRVLFLTILNGIVPDLRKIKEIAKKNNLFLIIDCTQAYGAKFEELDLVDWCDAAIYALCDLKDVHTHMGGMTLTNDEELYTKLKIDAVNILKPLKIKYLFKFVIEDFLALLIINRTLFSYFFYYLVQLGSLLGEDEIARLTSGKGLRIFNITILKGLFGGTNSIKKDFIDPHLLYSYSDYQASIGLRSLESVDEILDRRIKNTQTFLKKVNIPSEYLPRLNKNSKNTFWKLPIITTQNQRLKEYLFKNNVDSAKSNLPCLPSLKGFGFEGVEVANAEFVRENSLYIPLHHYLNEEEVLQIASLVTDFFAGEKK
jgi:perosamine synthetase